MGTTNETDGYGIQAADTIQQEENAMAVKSIAAVATLAAILLGTSAIAHIPKSCHAKYNQQIKAAHYDVQSAERVVRKRLKKAGWSEDKEEMKKIVYLLLIEKKRISKLAKLLINLGACANKKK